MKNIKLNTGSFESEVNEFKGKSVEEIMEILEEREDVEKLKKAKEIKEKYPMIGELDDDYKPDYIEISFQDNMGAFIQNA